MQLTIVGSLLDKQAFITVDPTQDHSIVSEDFVLQHRLAQTYVKQSFTITRTISNAPIIVPTTSGNYHSTTALLIGNLADCDVRLGSDWIRASHARIHEGSFLDPTLESISQRSSAHTWEASLPDNLPSSTVKPSEDAARSTTVSSTFNIVPDAFEHVFNSSDIPYTWTRANPWEATVQDALSLTEPAAPHEDRSDCWFETSALVGEASNPDEKKEVPIKLFQVQYDPSQPPPGSNLDKPGKRLVHFIAVAFGPQLVPRRVSDLSFYQLFIVADRLHRALTVDASRIELLGPTAALHAEFLLTFPTANDELKSMITNNIMRLSAIFQFKTDKLYIPTAGGTLPASTRIKFRDYYAAETLLLAFALIQREFFVPKEIHEEGIRIGYRFLRFCVHSYRHPSLGFEERAGFCAISRVQELENAVNNLVFCLEHCYLAHGGVRVLDEAMRLFREVFRLPEMGSVMRFTLYCILSSVLQYRAEERSRMEDVAECLEISERCLSLATDDQDRHTAHFYVANAYKLRYRWSQDDEDLSQGIHHCQLAMQDVSEADADSVLDQYAAMLYLRWDKEKNVADLDEAIRATHQAIEHPHGKLINLENHYTSLAGLLFLRFEATEDPQDAADCLEYADRALTPAYEGDGRRNSRALLAKAQLLVNSKSPFNDLHTSVALVREIVDSEAYLAGERIECVGKYWGETRYFDADGFAADTEAHQALLDVVVSAVHLIPRFADFTLEVSERLVALRRFAEGLPLSAANIAIVLGHTELAVEMIEEGRAMFWAQALHLRTALDDLPEDLRVALGAHARQLEEDGFRRAGLSADPRENDIDMARRRQTAEEYLELVERARAIPGFERFMLPQTFAYLAKAAEKGPVVLLTSGAEMCIAVLITSDGAARRMNLPTSLDALKMAAKLWQDSSACMRKLSRDGKPLRDEIGPQSEQLLNALEEQLDHARAVKGPRKKKAPRTTVSDAVLEILWFGVVNPILRTLGLKKVSVGQDRPRLWWCTSRTFASLPLHAAEWHSNGHTERCSDYVVSSYTPTLQALIDARKAYRPVRRSQARMLLGAAPHPYIGTSIPSTIREIQTLSSTLPPSLILPLPDSDDVLVSPHAGLSVPTALGTLPSATILHIASHGEQDGAHPLSSGFLLRDDRLTVLQLMRAPLPQAFMAFLSACETAKASGDSADETVHLAMAMLFAGFKSVVGTMWSMDDLDGPEVARKVYERLFEGEGEYLDPDVVPYALDEAARALREKGVSPSRWATYIHIGM